MLICDLRWAEGGRSLPHPSTARRPLVQHHYENEGDDLSLSWPVALLGAIPQAPAHIPGSNPTLEPELWGQDSGNVSGRPGTAPQVYGGQICPFPELGL